MIIIRNFFSASTGNVVGEIHNDNVPDESGKRKNYFKSSIVVYKSNDYGINGYLCTGKMTWIGDNPTSRFRDSFAFNWTGNALFDSNYSSYNMGTLSWSRTHTGIANIETFSESKNTDISYVGGKIQFNFDLPANKSYSGGLSGTSDTYRNFSIYAQVVLNSAANFNFAIGYGHKYLAIAATPTVSYPGGIGISFTPSFGVKEYCPEPLLIAV